MISLEDIESIDLTRLSGPLKRVALIHDLSGFGKASLTVALPILAAAGIEGICIPTALLSTHTGDFFNFTYKDLTDEIPGILKHYNSFNLTFNAIYSGYLSSSKQVNILLELIKDQKRKNPDLTVFVDPVMGDDGKLYKAYKEELIEKNRELIKKADIIFPNMTESYYLLDEDYRNGPYSEEEIRRAAEKLKSMSHASVIITGIKLPDNKMGIAVCSRNGFDVISFPCLEGVFHGTGDVFASFFIGSCLNGFSLYDSAKLAGTLVYYAAKRTVARNQPRRDGLDFEGVLPLYIKCLNENVSMY